MISIKQSIELYSWSLKIMDNKKCMFVLILSIFVLFGMACVCAGEVNETTMGVIDADNLKISEDNQAIEQSNDFIGVDESANITLNDVGLDETFQSGSAGEDILSSGEENELTAGKVITVSGSSFGKIKDAIKSASDGDVIVLSKTTYEGGKGDSITINKQIKIEGNGAVLNIYEKANIFTITAKNVILDNICFIGGSSYGGGAISLTESSSNCTVSNCQFTNNHATRGSAVYDLGSNNKVLNCNIYDNVAEYGAVHSRGLNITISDCTFTGNEATTGGGAVFIAGSYATVQNCKFSDNFAKSYAGALQFNYNSVNCSVINSAFYYNYVTNSEAGAISDSGSGNVISHCDFIDNRIYGSGVIGAAIESSGNNVEISYCNFTNHSSNYGAIYLTDKSFNCTVSNSIFTNNIARYTGGAISDNGNRNRILKCDFNKNFAGKGPVFLSGVDGTIDDCVFFENVGIFGGAVYLNSTSSGSTVSNSKFIKNTADNGGAINNHGRLTLINSIFDSNSADFGGAVFNNNEMEIVDCEFINNQANLGDDNGTADSLMVATSNCGGAILNQAVLILSDSIFENNNAILCGGAISNIAILNLANCIFKENSASFGGAILNLDNMDVAGSNFTNNVATSEGGAIFTQHGLNVSDCQFEINTAQMGGAIFNYKGALTIIDSTLANNYATDNGGAVFNLDTFGGKNTKFKNNRAKNGGAIANMDDSNIEDCTFEDNVATERGGAIYSQRAILEVSDSTFTGNGAENGGAIHSNRGTFTIYDSKLTNNNAALVGGAIVLVGEYVNQVINMSGYSYFSSYKLGFGKMINVTIDNNTATKLGAGIYDDNCDLEISDSILSNNHNAASGGAIYNNATMILKNSILECNSANYGGAFYLAQYDVLVMNSTFERNVAKGGGAILNLNSSLDIIESTFIENTANPGSAIWTGKADSLRLKEGTTFIDNYNNLNSIRADEGSVDLSNCEFICSLSFEIGHIDDVYLNSPVTVDVVAKMKNGLVLNGNVIVEIGGEKHNVKITDGKGKLTVTPKLGAGKYKATINTNEKNFTPASAESNEFSIYAKTSFFALNKLIKNADKTLNLNMDYTYDPDSDSEFKDGIIIDNDLTISGNGKTIDADGKARIFYISKNSKVEINNLNFKNANTKGNGGAISNEGDLTVTKSTMVDNSADKGGAVYNGGDLKITDATMVNNSASEGGAVYNGGDLTIADSVLTSNSANNGGAIHNTNVLNVESSTIDNNTASNSGGAIDNEGSLTITDAVLVNNQADDGGAIYNDDKVTINNSTMANNNATNGSAIWTKNGDDVEITDSTFVDNVNNDEAISSENGEVNTSESKFQNAVSFKISNINDFISGQAITIRVTETLRGSEVNGRVTVIIGGEKYVIDIIKGSGTKTITSNVNPGKYTAKLTFDETEKYTSTTAESNKFTVTKRPNIQISNMADVIVGNPIVLKLSADSLFCGDVVVKIAGVDYEISIVNGSGFKTITPTLGPGTYNAVINFLGNDKFVAQNVTSNDFKVVEKASTVILSSTVTTVYNGGKYLVATLKDSAGNPIKGAKLTIKLSSGKSFTANTDKNGRAKVTTNGMVPKTYTASVNFAGNAKYDASSKKVKLTVKKASTKLTASSKAFRVKATKKLTATLKDSKNKIIKGKYITFKFNGKNYKVKTNSKGIASKLFKVTKIGTYRVNIKFAGDKCYKASSKTVNLVVK